jgi:hypothetical protein
MHDVSHPNDFERSDADPRLISALALGVAVFLLSVPFLILVGYPDAGRLGGIPDNSPPPPGPRLQVAPQADLDRLRASESNRLTTFGWVDRNKQIARMPIEQAIKLLAERGLAGWPSSETSSAHQPPK